MKWEDEWPEWLSTSVWCKATSLSITLPVSDREVTQKTRALQRFMEYWFILAEAHLPQNREDCKQKASALHPVAAAGVVHPAGTKAFPLFSISSGQGRRAGWEITIIAAAELQPENPDTAPEWDEKFSTSPSLPHGLHKRKPNNHPCISRVLVWQKHQVIITLILS